MIGGIDWSALTPAAAFVLGAVLATIAVLRVVRAVAAMFGGEVRRARRPERSATPARSSPDAPGCDLPGDPPPGGT